MAGHLSEELQNRGLATPCFVIDLTKVKANCQRLLNLCSEMNVSLRAQTKTHKTLEGAILQTGGSKRCIVCSTLKECEFYAENGFDDILFGYPLIFQHIKRVFKLTETLKEFHVFIHSLASLELLNETEPPTGKKWSAFLKVDCGNKRAGVSWDSNEIEQIGERIVASSSRISFQGLYAHCGNTYHAKSEQEVEDIRNNTIENLVEVSRRLADLGLESGTVGIGSTPSCSHEDVRMSRVSELHPGNYIFYDVQQYSLGSCQLDDIACCIATRVLSHCPQRNEMLIDCGFTALTKQTSPDLPSGFGIFRNHPNLKLSSMTQEIGKVVSVAGRLNFEKYPPGCLLFIYPWHSCATADKHRSYVVVENNEIVDTWVPAQGW